MIKLIIADSRMPEKAKNNLESFGKVLWLEPQQIVYESIAAHPDIFFFQNDNTLIIAPNAPERWMNYLQKMQVDFEIGEKKLGAKHPETVFYNAVKSGKHLIHNLKFSDSSILNYFEKENQINVNQAYTRCNLIPLDENHFITSDLGIEKILLKHNFDVLFIDPRQVSLSNQNNGFFPGCCGLIDHTLLVCGSTKNLREKQQLDFFLKKNDVTLVELYDGPLVDVGSILAVMC